MISKILCYVITVSTFVYLAFRETFLLFIGVITEKRFKNNIQWLKMGTELYISMVNIMPECTCEISQRYLNHVLEEAYG